MRKCTVLAALIVSVLMVTTALIASLLYPTGGEERISPSDPFNTRYIVDNTSVELVNGFYEQEVAPGSASKLMIRIWGEPVWGDMNGDGYDDALVILVSDAGGSGTLYYAALATKGAGGFYGTNAIFLGDRIAPQNSAILNGVAIANYAVRMLDEPMAARPSVGVSKYMTFDGNELKEVEPLSEGEEVMFGYLAVGHEVRSFRPCGEAEPEYWILGDSPALEEVKDVYAHEVVAAAPYTPLFAVIAGRITDAPEDGFGADYEHAVYVRSLIRFAREESCESDSIVVTSPLAGETITSPLTVKGRARSDWYSGGGFSIHLTDWDGRIIASGRVGGVGSETTSSFVPFSGSIEFDASVLADAFSKRGVLILQREGPSGQADHANALEIPVVFE